jgi:hypothetical protein
MGKVFVTQDVLVRSLEGDFVRKFDLTSAERFGALEVLVSSAQSMFSSVPVVRQLRERLADFGEDDYLLPIGDPSVMAAAAMVAGARNNGRIKILKWDRRGGCYVPVQVDISGSMQ